MIIDCRELVRRILLCRLYCDQDRMHENARREGEKRPANKVSRVAQGLSENCPQRTGRSLFGPRVERLIWASTLSLGNQEAGSLRTRARQRKENLTEPRKRRAPRPSRPRCVFNVLWRAV